MAHELTETNGRVEFAYRADHGLPWHGLGQAVPEADYQSLESWQAHAGMQWRVKRSQVRYVVDAAGTTLTDKENHVLFRSDNKARLGLVSAKYKTVQPSEIFELFRGIVRAGGLEISAAGTIRGGQRFWCTAQIGEAAPISLHDKVRSQLLIVTSADGSLKTTVSRRATRAVCANTLAMAASEGAADYSLSHRSVFDPEEVRDYMGLNTAAWDHFRHTIVRLANRPIVEADAEPTVLAILDAKPATVDATRDSAAFKKILALFNGDAIGSSLDGVQGTAWGMLNAVTEYVDHHVRASNDENRLISAQWGAGNTLKSRALALLSA
jgi:phage/plasmid-like protein (TIGR03299 family)